MLIWILVISKVSQDVQNKESNYTKRESLDYFSTENITENPWTIDTSEVTIAGTLYKHKAESDLAVDSIARIQFYLYEKSRQTEHSFEEKVTYVPAKKCSEIYSDRMDPSSQNYDATISYEFEEVSEDAMWICPDISSFTLSGDPWSRMHAEGQSLVMIVNSCIVAKKYD